MSGPTVEFEDESSFLFAKVRFQILHSKIKHSPGSYPDEVVRDVESVVRAFEAPGAELDLDEQKVSPPLSPQPPKKRKPRAPKGEARIVIKNGCPTHPKSTPPQRAPKTDCIGCWASYKFYQPGNFPMAKRRFERNHGVTINV